MKEKLKIAYFLDNFFPQVNGVVTSSINTIHEFAKKGHEIYGIAPYSCLIDSCPKDYFPYKVFFQKGIQAFFYPDFIFTYPFNNKIVSIMKKFKPDIIHFHAPFTIGYQAIRTAKILNIPVVGTFHTFFAEPEYLSIIGKEESRFLNRFGWWYSNQFFNRCDIVVSPAKYTAKILSENKMRKEIKIISNGVNVSKYKKFKFNPGKFPLNIKDSEEWIIFIGRISKEKSLDILINSFKIVLNKNKNIRLLIVGDGPYKKALINYCNELNISKYIYFSGMIPNKDLLESGILKKMKLFITPSTSENQPMTVLEAIMFGLPVVGVDAKGITELIEDNGILVRPNNIKDMANAVLNILDRKSLYREFRQKSFYLSNKYDISYTTNNMEELYYQVIEERMKEATEPEKYYIEKYKILKYKKKQI